MNHSESIFGKEQDLIFMNQALALADEAYQHDEVPIGALIVDEQGTVIARAYNQTESCQTQAAHAEIEAIKQAGKRQEDWRLNGCWLYVTLEPCAMCMHLIRLSRLAGIVFAAPSPLFGYRLDSAQAFRVYQKHAFSIVEGVAKEQASEVLKRFFKGKRGDAGEFIQTKP